MEKRYNSRCMYGNYKPSYEFYDQSGPRHHFIHKKLVRAVFVALAALFLIFLVGCKQQQTIIKEETVTRYVDSTIWHTDTSYYQLPVEVYSDYTGLLDTLRLENTYSYAWSAVDTNKMILIGELKSKNVKVPVEYKWKERIIYQDTTIFKEKEIQVPVEKEVVKTKYPWWSWVCLCWTLICLVYVGFKIYLKFWKP